MDSRRRYRNAIVLLAMLLFTVIHPRIAAAAAAAARTVDVDPASGSQEQSPPQEQAPQDQEQVPQDQQQQQPEQQQQQQPEQQQQQQQQQPEQQQQQQQPEQQQQQQFPQQRTNSPPCIYDSRRSFSYMHIGYVPYFNTSNRLPTFCTTDECLDICTADCTCTAVVFDVPHDSCFVYHDTISMQSFQILPVMPLDTVSVYVKVQRGRSSAAGAGAAGMRAAIVVAACQSLLLLLL